MHPNPSVTSAAQAAPRAKILLVDDERSNLMVLEAVLDGLGHDLVKAASGEEALRLLLDHDFAVVLLDVRMQGMDGFETAKHVRGRERSRHTPIVFLSAYDDNRLPVEEAYSLGAVDYLVKPVSPVILRAKVTGFVELFRKTEQVQQQAEQLRQLERREFERKLAEENARFRALTEYSSDAVTLISPTGIVQYAAPSVRRVLGYEPDEYVGRSGFELVHPDDQAWVGVRLAELVAAPGGTVTVEMRAAHKDGSWRWVECVGTNLLAEPAVKAVVVNFRDVTARRRAIDALRESEERIRTLSDNLPHGAIYQLIVDREGRGGFTYFSAGVEKLFGVTPEEATRDPMTIYGLIHPQDLPGLRAAEAAALAALAPFDCEFRQGRRPGGFVWVHCRSAPRLLPDGRTIWDGVLLDVTDRKKAEQASHESEERFRRLFEADIIGVGISDAAGAWLEANDELLRMVGYSREELGAGKVRWLDMTPARFLPLDEQGVAEARRRGSCTPYEKEYIRKDGSPVPILIGYTRLQSGGQERFLCFVLNLTPQKRVEAALKAADRRKDEFLAMLAHELRNPLAPIRNAAQALRSRGGADPDQHRAAATIERQVGHLARMVDDLLDVSRFTEGKIKVDRAPVELAAVVARAVETSRPLIDARRHDLKATLPAEPIAVEADATRLAQVVSNLLNNAAKFTEDGGQIELMVERLPGEAVVRVRDTGMGIPAELLPHVFDLFTQGDRSLARSEGGLGIGLTLVKSLVELHGGTVAASSDGLGKGSEFVVRLPTLAMAPTPADGAGRTDRRAAAPRRVLIVDDNVDAAEMLALLLQTEGHEVRTAHDGPAALRSAETFNPEVVFLDIGLPRMDGYEVARLLRRQERKPALLVALTGYGRDEDRRRAEEAGFDAHLVKPADPAALQGLLGGAG
jgi:PAS domain S-box-containing protein